MQHSRSPKHRSGTVTGPQNGAAPRASASRLKRAPGASATRTTRFFFEAVTRPTCAACRFAVMLDDGRATEASLRRHARLAPIPGYSLQSDSAQSSYRAWIQWTSVDGRADHQGALLPLQILTGLLPGRARPAVMRCMIARCNMRSCEAGCYARHDRLLVHTTNTRLVARGSNLFGVEQVGTNLFGVRGRPVTA